MILELNTDIPFRPRVQAQQGEMISVRDGSGRVVETWECLAAKGGKVRFNAQGYKPASEI